MHKVYRATKNFWWLNPLNFVYPYLEKKCFKNSQKIITNSNFIKEQIIATYGIEPEKITTIYNGGKFTTKGAKSRGKARTL
ncbi:glycosyltransferase family 4 protein [Campylobacter concisus]